MKRIDFTQQGGFPLTQDILGFMQEGYSDLSAAIAAMLGGNVIVSGVQPNGAGYTGGWVVFDGELLPFVGGIYPNFVASVSAASETFADGQNKTVRFTKALVSVPAATPNSTAVNSLKRWNDTAEQSINDHNFAVKITKDCLNKLVRIDGFLFTETSEGDSIFTPAGQNFNYPASATLNIDGSTIYNQYGLAQINGIFYQTIIKYYSGYMNVRILTGGNGYNAASTYIMLNNTVKLL